MVFLTLSDFTGNSFRAVYSPTPEPIEPLLTADADCIVADWHADSGAQDLHRLFESGHRILVAECWQDVLPEAELLISSSISGGSLRQRFRQLPAAKCWLRLERLCRTFPLPCPDGQGVPAAGLPETEGFYAVDLVCRYIHRPGEVTLFDTEETLERKIQLAQECGFRGVIYTTGISP